MFRYLITFFFCVFGALYADPANAEEIDWTTASFEEAQKFVQSGNEVNIFDEDGQTLLMKAAMNTSNPDVVNLLIDADADVNAQNKYGLTPLMIAAGKNNLAAVKLLLNNGANVNATSKKGITALHLSMFSKNSELIKELLRAGADVNAQEEKHITALMIASSEEVNASPDIKEMLIKAGAK